MNGFFSEQRLKLPLVLVLLSGLWLAPEEPLYAKNAFIARAQFTTSVTNREPDNSISTISSSAGIVYFFSELINMTGSTVSHRWLYKSSEVAKVSFEVKGPRWRVYSSKQLEDWMAGDWTIEVLVDDEPLEETYMLQVIDDNSTTLTQQTSNTDARINRKPDLPAEILALQQLFPDTGVTSISMRGNTAACPPADYFQWQMKTANLWYYQMANSHKIPVTIDDTNPQQPYSTTNGGCVSETTHQLSQDRSELISKTTDTCISTSLPVSSVTTIKRHGEELDLLIFADTMSHCRYQIRQ